MGTSALIIRDTPVADDDYRTCYLKGMHCAASRQKALAGGALDVEVAREFGNLVTGADFSDAICDAAACPVVRDGLLVYRDTNHITPTYAATFAPQMGQLLRGFAEKQALQAKLRGATSVLGRDTTQAPN